MCWLGVTVGCSGIWLGSQDEIGCLVKRWGGDVGGFSSEVWWFGHLERRDERDALGRVQLVEAPGR